MEADGEGEVKCLSERMINGLALDWHRLGGNFLIGSTEVSEGEPGTM